MIIVSQNGLRTSENMEIGIYPEYEDKNSEKIIGYKLENDYMYLGSYKTEERAKEVLQEIVKQKAMFELYRLAPTGGREQTEMLENFAQKRIILDTYEMPKE